jgi:hypothetical protein
MNSGGDRSKRLTVHAFEEHMPLVMYDSSGPAEIEPDRRALKHAAFPYFVSLFKRMTIELVRAKSPGGADE